jgi:mannose-6-phosphate isomerase-like protein (cupin superfamily)
MVTKGRILVTVEGRESVLAAGDEPIIVPRWKIHGMRGFQEEAFALKERTNPTGSFKQELVYLTITNCSSSVIICSL